MTWNLFSNQEVFRAQMNALVPLIHSITGLSRLPTETTQPITLCARVCVCVLLDLAELKSDETQMP